MKRKSRRVWKINSFKNVWDENKIPSYDIFAAAGDVVWNGVGESQMPPKGQEVNAHSHRRQAALTYKVHETCPVHMALVYGVQVSEICLC